ncbi:MAG: SDR family oxidoreductase [Acidimicrobiia bacterium]
MKPQSMFDLDGQVAVLTGAGSGIGRATAVTLAAAGARCVLGDINADSVEETAEMVRSEGGTAVVQVTDVTSREQVEALVQIAASQFQRLDIMGNIAGVPFNKMFAEVSDEDFERILAINLKSVVYGCQAALKVMEGPGNIVNVSSGAIDTPAPTLSCYGMTKAAVAMLTKTLATEVGPKGIRVNALAPGIIETNFSTHNFTNADGTVDPEKQEAYRKRFGGMAPLRRVGVAQDVANTILYLVSDAASFMTGQILRPNGGVAMPW